jgi:hypothetical protein
MTVADRTFFSDGGWTRLPPVDIMPSGTVWHWTGRRLVAPYSECIDGGEVNNYGRCIPTGGALEVASGTWRAIPSAPVHRHGAGLSLAAAEGSLVATWGHLYDDTDHSWTPLTAPPGAQDLGGVAAVIADGDLIAFGGLTWSDGEGIFPEGEATNQAWVLRR